MNNKHTILIILLTMMVIFSACESIVTEDNNSLMLNTEESISQDSEQKIDKTDDNINKDIQLNKLMNILNDNLEVIENRNLSYDERIDEVMKFIENLNLLLSMKESMMLEDEDLEKALGNKVVSKTKMFASSGIEYKIRIVRYNGLSELHGTLERMWTFLQIQDNNKVFNQLLVEESSKIIDDFYLLKTNDRLIITLTGYLTIYKPNPVFASSWQFEGGKWKKVSIFDSNILSNDIWSYDIYNNDLIIENKNKSNILIRVNEESNGFEIYLQNDSTEKVQFKVINDKLRLIEVE